MTMIEFLTKTLPDEKITTNS